MVDEIGVFREPYWNQLLQDNAKLHWYNKVLEMIVQEKFFFCKCTRNNEEDENSNDHVIVFWNCWHIHLKNSGLFVIDLLNRLVTVINQSIKQQAPNWFPKILLTSYGRARRAFRSWSSSKKTLIYYFCLINEIFALFYRFRKILEIQRMRRNENQPEFSFNCVFSALEGTRKKHEMTLEEDINHVHPCYVFLHWSQHPVVGSIEF